MTDHTIDLLLPPFVEISGPGPAPKRITNAVKLAAFAYDCTGDPETVTAETSWLLRRLAASGPDDTGAFTVAVPRPMRFWMTHKGDPTLHKAHFIHLKSRNAPADSPELGGTLCTQNLQLKPVTGKCTLEWDSLSQTLHITPTQYPLTLLVTLTDITFVRRLVWYEKHFQYWQLKDIFALNKECKCKSI